MFQRGNNCGSRGRTPGTKNKLSRAFCEDLLESYRKHGAAAMEIGWVQQPLAMLKLIASLEPRQLRYEGVASTLSDEQLDAIEAVLIEAQAQIGDAKPQALPAPQPGRITIVGVPRNEKETRQPPR